MAEAGIEPDYKLIKKAEFTGLSGYRVMKNIWESKVEVTGAFCANDSVAAGAMRYLYDINVRIPDDFSIIGYEHSIVSEHVIPALTSVQICKEKWV